MHFTSFTFMVFMLVVFLVYHLLKHKQQNLWLLAASYGFYGFWSWPFCLLLMFSTLANFLFGALIFRAGDKRAKRRLLWVGVATNLVILGFFKYYNFFADSLTAFLGVFGLQASWHLTGLILPLGISFYTFQALGYTIDVYRGKLKPVASILDFGLFVTFFPQLVAGPIERATNLLPQIAKPRNLKARDLLSGCWLIYLGIFKKVVVADQLGRFVQVIFSPAESYAGLDVALGCVFFSLQVYADFSGYTDMARGTAKLLGFDLMRNFRAPYFARNIQDFWARWHISLTTWIKDYLFFPLALSRRWSKLLGAGGISLVVMGIMGLWHGASWNFVVWGMFHGLVIHIYTKIRPWLYRHTRFQGWLLPRVWLFVCVLFTFSLVAFSEIFFRNKELAQAWSMMCSLVTNPVVGKANLEMVTMAGLVWVVPFFLDCYEWGNKEKEPLATWHPAISFSLRVAMLIALVLLHTKPQMLDIKPYVYFEF